MPHDLKGRLDSTSFWNTWTKIKKMEHTKTQGPKQLRHAWVKPVRQTGLRKQHTGTHAYLDLTGRSVPLGRTERLNRTEWKVDSIASFHHASEIWRLETLWRTNGVRKKT